jgi:hypothetical protein
MCFFVPTIILLEELIIFKTRFVIPNPTSRKIRTNEIIPIIKWAVIEEAYLVHWVGSGFTPLSNRIGIEVINVKRESDPQKAMCK